MNIPPQHQGVMPYLMLHEAKRFINFACAVFNAEITFSQLREDEKTLMHCELQINGCTIMFCDATADWPPTPANLFVYVPNADDTFGKAITAGAETIKPLKDESYGRTCGVKDPCGNVWWVTSLK
jgi:PhnB protein